MQNRTVATSFMLIGACDNFLNSILYSSSEISIVSFHSCMSSPGWEIQELYKMLSFIILFHIISPVPLHSCKGFRIKIKNPDMRLIKVSEPDRGINILRGDYSWKFSLIQSTCCLIFLFNLYLIICFR